MIEAMLIVPFFILLMMIMLEFVIYFYKSNVVENTAQHIGRMVARGATHADISAYADDKLASITPTSTSIEVRDAADAVVVAWASDDALVIRLTATVEPLMPIGVLNIFAPGTDFFPDEYNLGSAKQVYVE